MQVLPVFAVRHGRKKAEDEDEDDRKHQIIVLVVVLVLVLESLNHQTSAMQFITLEPEER